jgi:hypothetical protein
MKPGSSILWKQNGWLAKVLSTVLAWKDKSWRARVWRAWHTGFIIKVLDTGEIVTFQAVNLKQGTCVITYDSVADMGDCIVYDWLEYPNTDFIESYVAQCNGMPYDGLAYFWVIVTVLFGWHWQVSDKRLMCWENLINFCAYMGKPLQPFWEEPIISKMMNVLETVTSTHYNQGG